MLYPFAMIKFVGNTYFYAQFLKETTHVLALTSYKIQNALLIYI